MKKFKMIAVAFVVVTLSAFTLKPAPTGYKVGDIATDFSLKTSTAGWFHSKITTTPKDFIVIFTCNHCPFAKAYEDRIVALDKQYSNLGYPVIAINPNNPAKQPEDSFENMRRRAKEKRLRSHICSTKDRKFTHSTALPKRHTCIYCKKLPKAMS
jgi:hypothetical protein